MTRYRLEKKLPSLSIDKQFVESIEDVLVGANEKGDFAYSMTIQDSIGEEVFSTIRDLGRDDFPNDTKSIVLNVSGMNSDSTSISIRLEHGALSQARVTISSGDVKARERCYGLLSEIELRARERQNMNYLFFEPWSFLPMILAGLVIGLATNDLNTIGKQVVLVLFCILLAWFSLRVIPPFIAVPKSKNLKQPVPASG